MFHEAVHDANFRNGVERPSRVASQPFCICNGCKKDDRVATDVNIFLKSFPLFCCEFWMLWIKRQNGILVQWNWKLVSIITTPPSPAIAVASTRGSSISVPPLAASASIHRSALAIEACVKGTASRSKLACWFENAITLKRSPARRCRRHSRSAALASMMDAPAMEPEDVHQEHHRHARHPRAAVAREVGHHREREVPVAAGAPVRDDARRLGRRRARAVRREHHVAVERHLGLREAHPHPRPIGHRGDRVRGRGHRHRAPEVEHQVEPQPVRDVGRARRRDAVGATSPS